MACMSNIVLFIITEKTPPCIVLVCIFLSYLSFSFKCVFSPICYVCLILVDVFTLFQDVILHFCGIFAHFGQLLLPILYLHLTVNILVHTENMLAWFHIHVILFIQSALSLGFQYVFISSRYSTIVHVCSIHIFLIDFVILFLGNLSFPLSSSMLFPCCLQ